jgi:hypothetical protein
LLVVRKVQGRFGRQQGGRAKEQYAKEAKKRQRMSGGRGQKGPANLADLKGDARDKAAKAVGVSGRSVDHDDEKKICGPVDSNRTLPNNLFVGRASSTGKGLENPDARFLRWFP